ncbi:MAG: hypothetical protein A3I77_06725 [Gammaproteobacteria bacterium RIFCSPLOWO2_02_FULL_42_14]|nr:MAG: hypothetical protein A3E54_04065 [Gammaproteobacteria bacterium RIFCSPHIGHO2_12_FULL_41_25]OGT61063.1 MAG: hypothetical protein A3I77_06725 [Gammaproteobacteria bacterium RIFCSPLOWO2_02_FULL_42_14]OGT86990.1 MAG: hypothetical protein A3G86_00445 [Gammaproteobacteria bacterium RIFCSPLOWO2_12_FULL_42_18]
MVVVSAPVAAAAIGLIIVILLIPGLYKNESYRVDLRESLNGSEYFLKISVRQKNYRVIPEIFVLKNYPESSVFLLDPG